MDSVTTQHNCSDSAKEIAAVFFTHKFPRDETLYHHKKTFTNVISVAQSLVFNYICMYKPKHRNMKHIFPIRLLSAIILIALTAFNAAALKFTLLTDIHVTPGNKNEVQLKAAIDEINKNNSQFVILSGDLSNEGSDEQLYNVKSILDKLTKPIYVIPGNHENNWSQSATKTFVDIWGDDRFVFETDSLIFIGINCGPFMKMGDGHVKQEDLIWLEKELSTRCTSGKKVVSINHYPLQEELDNWQDYATILHKYPTIIHICGHFHTYRQYKGGDIDALVCRALDMTRVKDGYGYTDFNITDDSIYVYDKIINQDPQLKFQIPIKASHPAFKRPKDKHEIKKPEGFTINRIYQDVASIFTRVAVDKNAIYFGNSLGDAKAIDRHTGEVKWSLHTDASLFSRPALTSDYVILPTGDKQIIWIDKKTGRSIRANSSEGPYVADGLVVGNCLYQGGYKKFECWNTNTGNLRWRTELNNYCQAEPVIDGDDVIFGTWDTYLRCLDKKTGKLKWQWSNGSTANLYSPGNCIPAVLKDRVVIVAPDRYMTALDRKTGKVIWRTNFDKKYKVRESFGVSKDSKLVYAKTMDGQLIAVNPNLNEPEVAFVVDAGIGYEHAPCNIIEDNGVIYMGSRKGEVIAIDANTHKLLWVYKCGSSEVNGFERFNGSIYVSLTEGCIWEIRKK